MEVAVNDGRKLVVWNLVPDYADGIIAELEAAARRHAAEGNERDARRVAWLIAMAQDYATVVYRAPEGGRGAPPPPRTGTGAHRVPAAPRRFRRTRRFFGMLRGVRFAH